MFGAPLPDRFDISGRTALVTGASSGLGGHFAEILAAAGAKVILAARRIDSLEKAAEKISAAGGKCDIASLDVADKASVDALRPILADTDILINNAGIVKQSTALALSEQDWDDVMDTNLKGMFFVAQAAAVAMKERGGGSIINIASILAQRQSKGVAPYAISKSGAIQLTKVLALEWARFGIRVNAIAPGYIRTELNQAFFLSDAGQRMIERIPQRRLGMFTDLEGPLLLLASDASAYMTGSVIEVDGGHLLSDL